MSPELKDSGSAAPGARSGARRSASRDHLARRDANEGSVTYEKTGGGGYANEEVSIGGVEWSGDGVSASDAGAGGAPTFNLFSFTSSNSRLQHAVYCRCCLL